MKNFIRVAVAGGVLAVAASAKAADMGQADECGVPCFEVSGYAELNGDWYFPSDNSVDSSQDVHPKSEVEMKFTPFDHFSVLTNIVTEPVSDPEPGEDRFFKDTGTYAEILQGQVEIGALTLFGGKIHPAFGRAWDVTPGLHGTDLAEDYELSERIGGGASLAFEALGLSNALSFSAFTADRTILSESLFTNRGRLHLSDGGAGNTDGISSVAVALDGCLGAEIDSCYAEGTFGYQIAGRYQKGGEDSDGDETGIIGSLNKSFEVGEDMSVLLFGEVGWFQHFDGGSDDAFTLTGSGALKDGPFTYSLAYTQLRTDATEHQVDASAIYSLGDLVSVAGETWSLGAGYTFDRADEEDTHIVGLRLRADFEGAASLAN
ncbi:hypothetical protein [Taklimakanibacter albus]|uniref:Uncharacterized protein n=1 Tax=Taklimakanibacter albus TaxID=2800327 RepID=A0ACC5RFI8_9HYPH|nr:hypothetical protein [Aestuariivirga sp. YIM B02566]MBK1871484.1 hypothetical protein [Aestuariivirga sp. YIM B02566]